MTLLNFTDQDVYLKPGEMYLPRQQAARVLTVLGSCVAVALYDAQRSITSLCHAVYSRPSGSSPGSDPHYVEDAIALMLRWHHRHGTVHRLVVKLFGGANYMFGEPAVGNGLGVGSSNVAAARRVLSDHGLSVAAEDVGGRQGRRLVLHPTTGTVHLFRLRAP